MPVERGVRSVDPWSVLALRFFFCDAPKTDNDRLLTGACIFSPEMNVFCSMKFKEVQKISLIYTVLFTSRRRGPWSALVRLPGLLKFQSTDIIALLKAKNETLIEWCNAKFRCFKRLITVMVCYIPHLYTQPLFFIILEVELAWECSNMNACHVIAWRILQGPTKLVSAGEGEGRKEFYLGLNYLLISGLRPFAT